MIYKSQFQKIDLYDWFCGPVSHMYVPRAPEKQQIPCVFAHTWRIKLILIL